MILAARSGDSWLVIVPKTYPVIPGLGLAPLIRLINWVWAEYSFMTIQLTKPTLNPGMQLMDFLLTAYLGRIQVQYRL